ncbi:MAG TPA: hypothetical protein VFZ61_20230 [Polyangiales bacterium]
MLSRVFYALLGVRFVDNLATWQLLDTDLLKQDLWRSLVYLHSQPPAFNLWVGAILKLAPDPATAEMLFHASLLLCGAVLYGALFELALRLGTTPWIAFLVSSAFITTPSAILYENWLFYPMALAAVLTLAAVVLHVYLEQRQRWQALLFFALLALLSCLQSTFHPALAVLALVCLALLRPASRRDLAWAAAPALALLLALCLKNALLFGHSSLSSWGGMSVGRVILVNVPEEQRQALVARQELSPLALIEPFSPLEQYPDRYRHVAGFEQVPALRQERKASGQTNYNHLGYVSISEQYLADAQTLLRHAPAAYLKGVLRSFFVYTKSTSDYGFLIDNLRQIAALDELYNRVLFGKVAVSSTLFPHVRGDAYKPYSIYLTLLLGLPLVFAFGLRGALWPHPRYGPTRNQRVVLAFMCFYVLWVALVGNLLESGENNRFRFTTDPLSAGIFALALQTLWTRLHLGAGRKAPHSSHTESALPSA